MGFLVDVFMREKTYFTQLVFPSYP